MTRGEDFIKKGRCKNKHCSAMSNSAWCDLNSQSNILKLHKCPKINLNININIKFNLLKPR